MGTFTGGGSAAYYNDNPIALNAKQADELPGQINKSSDSFHSNYAPPAYETGRNSNGETLESSLDKLSKNWTTYHGKEIIKEMQNLNADINSTLNSMKSALTDVASVTVEITYTESVEEEEV